MKKQTVKTVVMFIFVLLFVVMIGLLISMSKIDKQTEDTTTFYTATVVDVSINTVGDNTFAEIYTNEYSTALYVSTNIGNNIKIDDMENLTNGQRIIFGIEKAKVEQMDKVEFVNITSLKTDTKDIISLDDYNKYIRNSAYPARIVCSIMASLFFFVSILCYIKIKRCNMN